MSLKSFLALIAFLNFASGASVLQQSQASSSASRFSTTINTDSICELDERCVPYYKCMETDGAGIFAIRSHYDGASQQCESLSKCCEIQLINEEIPRVEMPESCGYRNLDGFGYHSIGKERESLYGEFPWTIAVLKKEVFGAKYMMLFKGGGSLIHPQVVLTAAHKIADEDPNGLMARGGEWNTLSTDEMFMHQERDIQGIVKHGNFTRKNLHNDIALLFLTKAFEIAPHVNTICMPELSYDNVGKNCFVTGWGKDKFGAAGNYQNFLKKVEVPVLEHARCQEMLRKTRVGEDFILNSSFMCAGGQKDVDVCTGDGGGALVCEIPNNPGFYYQAGIVSWGINCNQDGVPGVYMNVQKYLPWITWQMTSKGFAL